MPSYSLSCITADLFGQTLLKETSLSLKAYRTQQRVLSPVQESMTMLHPPFRSFTGCQCAIRCVIEILSQRSNALRFVHLSIFLAYLRSEIHDRATRHRNTLEIPFYKTATGQWSFLFRAVKLWNNLPEHLKCIDTLHNFKTSFRNILYNKFYFF